jgi:hypothetical protein
MRMKNIRNHQEVMHSILIWSLIDKSLRMIILEWFNVHFDGSIPILEWLHPNVRMVESESLDASTHWKKHVFVYLRCSMVTYHIHIGLSETTPQNYDHFDSWWSCSNVVKSWCLVHWSLNAPIFLYQTLAPPCQPGPRRPRCFWSGSARCSPGDVVPIRGPLSTESPVLSSQIFSPFF